MALGYKASQSHEVAEKFQITLLYRSESVILFEGVKHGDVRATGQEFNFSLRSRELKKLETSMKKRLIF